MKVCLLLAFALFGAYAQVTTWDLNELSPEAGIVEADKGKASFAAVHDKKAHNQGYTARYSQNGKSLKMSLTVQKETAVRVTDTDRLLFGIEGAEEAQEMEMANMTLSYAELSSLCESALGDNWETMVHLPTEDLTYIEALRLAASLNEYTLLGGTDGEINTAGTHRTRGSGYEATYDCICHGTKHKLEYDGYGDGAHEGPYWGIRVLGKHMYGRNYPHKVNSLGFDCLLCDGNSVGSESTDTEDPYHFEYDCRWCCFGKCAVLTGGEVFEDSPYAPYVPWCDRNYRFDGLYDSDGTNFFLLNDVGSCRLPRTYTCEAEVERWCSCDEFISVLYDENGTLYEDCDYCDKVVGANKYICPNCSASLEAIQAFGAAGNFTAGPDGTCDCNNAMWQLAYSSLRKDSKKGGYGGYGGYNAGYDSYNSPGYNTGYNGYSDNTYSDNTYSDNTYSSGDSYSGDSYSYPSGAYGDSYGNDNTYGNDNSYGNDNTYGDSYGNDNTYGNDNSYGNPQESTYSADNSYGESTSSYAPESYGWTSGYADNLDGNPSYSSSSYESSSSSYGSSSSGYGKDDDYFRTWSNYGY